MKSASVVIGLELKTCIVSALLMGKEWHFVVLNVQVAERLLLWLLKLQLCIIWHLCSLSLFTIAPNQGHKVQGAKSKCAMCLFDPLTQPADFANELVLLPGWIIMLISKFRCLKQNTGEYFHFTPTNSNTNLDDFCQTLQIGVNLWFTMISSSKLYASWAQANFCCGTSH